GNRACARCGSRAARGHPDLADRRGSVPTRRHGSLMARAPGGGRKSDRDLKVRVKSAKGRRVGSTLWLQRQLNDPYVARARTEGYRSRAAYKIKELDGRYKLFRRGQRVVDLGAAPGGWSQVAALATGSTDESPLVVAL